MQQFVFEDACETVECLPECHRYGIFELCTPHLNDICKIVAAFAELCNQLFQMRYKGQMAGIHSYMDCCRICVICRLRTVYMVV